MPSCPCPPPVAICQCGPPYRIACRNEGAQLRVEGALLDVGEPLTICCEVEGVCSEVIHVVYHTVIPVPEPSGTAGVLIGCLLLMLLKRRK